MEFIRFGLIVTGVGEALFLPKLFRSIMASAHCVFEVIRKSEQLDPITSKKKRLKMVGVGKTIPSIDEEQYGIPARQYLQEYPTALVLVIDDLEGTRKEHMAAVFGRYRLALDQMLDPLGVANRASVHFLVNMLEAYYFAHTKAVNTASEANLFAEDHPEDVELIRHPKNQLKAIWPGFDEIEHGAMVLDQLDLHHVLQHHDQCCWLRTLFYWCISRIPPESIWEPQLIQSYRLPDGCRVAITEHQQN